MARNRLRVLPDGTQIDAYANLKSLLSHVGHNKFAAIGGEPEQAFEQSFASLAWTTIQDKAPGLLDYVVGFQLLDRNEDNTKAVGIFGFKVDKQWLYAPVFFLAGKLKGHELLYSKNTGEFVPMDEGQINEIINKKPQILGEGIRGTLSSLGVRSPNMSDYSTPQMFKGGAWKRWTKEASVQDIYRDWVLSRRPAGCFEELDLGRLFQSSYRATKAACLMRQDYPALAQAFDQFYNLGTLKQALELHKKRLQEPSTVLQRHKTAEDEITMKVVIVTEQTFGNFTDLNSDEKSKLMREGFVVRDEREDDEVSKAYNTQVALALANPTESGIYEVLVKPGDFKRCLVLVYPLGSSGRLSGCTVVRWTTRRIGPTCTHPKCLSNRSRIWILAC